MQGRFPGKLKVNRIFVGGLLALSGFDPAFGQSDLPVGLSPAGEIFEDWRPPEFNGATLPGMRLEGVSAPQLLTALVPSVLAGKEVCVRVIAARDFYIGTQTFRVSTSWVGGLSAVPLVTRYISPPKDLSMINPDDALTRVSVGSCEKGTTDILLASGWKTIAGMSNLSIYVNATANNRVALEFPDTGIAVACEPRPDESAAYTHLCQVDAGSLGEGHHRMLVLAFSVMHRNGRPEEVLRLLTEAELWLAAP